MAEVKNSFLRSKMNKDLDDRLIPNGEYRDALNISVGKSEGKGVGSLEAILGNNIVVSTGNANLVCIGQVVDNQNNRIIQFWSDYVDVEETLMPPITGDMRITVYNADDLSLTTLVSGTFLNFATNNQYRILGANILEDLLFWVDNRNQPRKINITSALTTPGYYSNELQISVAKYAPVSPINVYLDIPVITTSVSTNPTIESISFTVSIENVKLLNIGMQLITDLSVPPVNIEDYAVITALDKITGEVIVSVPISTTTIPLGSTLHFYGTSMSNKADEPNWPGDPNFLKDKYVRFSYRYRFDDGEYSLMAPFTQILFIPNQNGYFLNGDEDAAYTSTVVSWMENYINNAELHIELPDTGNNIETSYKIESIDILYKESDSLAVKVLETVSSNQVKLIANSTNIYTYIYRSQKPYKTLPESQTVRVYDKVPVRARAQEIIGNRVIYGNFVTKSTPPPSIDYNLAISKKNESFTSWAEYPNHTLKQNRNYQAGIILSDKFGRQSAVILSSNDVGQLANGLDFVGSTIYSQYYPEEPPLDVKEWRGNTLAMVVNSPINSLKNEGLGTPGLYAIVSGEIEGSTDGFQIINPSLVTGNFYEFTLAASPAQRNYPKEGDYLRGRYTDYVKITLVTVVTPDNIEVTTDGQISEIYNYNGDDPDVKFSYSLNQLGWYSYKIVIRQQQQDYYNVYLPGILNGYPKFQTLTVGNPTIFPVNEENKTAHTVLLNDNINKIPRDLSEVGPDQKQYRSSVEIFGRVENLLQGGITDNMQYYPAKKPDVVSTIATAADLNFLQTNTPANVNGTASNNFYQLSTTPIIARISTVNRIGVIATTEITATPPLSEDTMNPYLSVYETSPVVSLLDIFWETSTSGLISDLNADVLSGSNIAVGFADLVFDHNEFQIPGSFGPPDEYGNEDSPYITNYFEPTNSIGGVVVVDSMTMTVFDLDGFDRSSDFELIRQLIGPAAGKFAIKILNPFVFLANANTKESYIFTFYIIDVINGNTVLTKTNKLKNTTPNISFPIESDPVEVFTIDDLIVGPIILCRGVNGAPVPIPPSTFNQQQLQWSVIDTVSDWSTYFSIDEITGVISLINLSVPTNVYWDTTIRLTDAYNFVTRGPSVGSLFYDRNIQILVPGVVNYCSDWNSFTGASIEPGEYINIITDGQFNFWKSMLPGETINVASTSVIIESYQSIDGISYTPLPYQQALTFSATNFDGIFTFGVNQIGDDTAVDTLHIVGNIRTSSGRDIIIDIFDQYTTSNPLNTTSAVDTCAAYIPDTNKSWGLTNGNTSSIIEWQALLSDGGTVIGNTLLPGEFVGSSFYGGSYPCIRENSLIFNAGGVAEYNICV